MDDIHYLIKFVTQESYADDLLNGKLYMNAAGNYCNSDSGRDDKYEAAVCGFFAGRNLPIYCMYAVFGKDVHKNKIEIPWQVLDDFNCRNGWAVLINYKMFDEILYSCDTHGYSMVWDLVKYGAPNCTPSEYFSLCMKSEDHVQLFVKRSKFKHQQEFRIVVSEKLPERLKVVYREDKKYKKIFDAYPLNTEKLEILDKVPYEARVYNLKGDIRDFAEKIKISDLDVTENGVLIPTKIIKNKE